MNPRELPAQVYEAFCPACGFRVEYALFQASFYSFGSYLEVSTGMLARLDLDAVHYQKLDVTRLLSETAQSLGISDGTGRWVDQTAELYCPRCRAIFQKADARDNRLCFDGKVLAYCVPPDG
jgi:hypothetical protein